MTEAPSGKLYFTVTKHWPRIAAGLVVLVGVVELVLGGLMADSGVEFYMMAWAGTTGGVWFLFEKAESALSESSRAQVTEWLTLTRFREGVSAIPEQFANLFDRVFGEQHLSWRCFLRSTLASAVMVSVLLTLEATGPWTQGVTQVMTAYAEGSEPFVIALSLPGLVAGAVLLNVVPDYLSLLQTRYAIKWAQRSHRLLAVLVIDFLATLVVSFVFISVVATGALIAVLVEIGPPLTQERFIEPFVGESALFQGSRTLLASYVRIYFLSAFFTSVWLWLHMLTWAISRTLVRMSGGVGFLLRVTDVERQPFRSMGFVSVIITSALFALGLPLVLF